MKKSLKWIFLAIFFIVLAALLAAGFYISSIYVNAKAMAIDENALSSSFVNIEVYDNENKPIKEDNEINKQYVKIENLTDNTKNAFISIEDKNFYNHNGVNYKRMVKALINDIKARKLKEGASTITQQLVKNTQLTSDKTIERKIKEIALAQKLEKRYSKDEILEKYLNIIYFGNNCYGIEAASNYYFSKSAKDLSAGEAATLAAIIKSPAKYSPTKNPENCLKRRNLVLSEMYKDQHIKTDEYNLAASKPLSLKINEKPKNKLNSYSQSAIDEAVSILKIPAKTIALRGYKIYTYQDSKKQEALSSAIDIDNLNCNSAAIVIDNNNHAVQAYVGSSNYKILDAKRQPGSCIKPVLVYAPALNEDIIYPCTPLLDEKTTISDYSPKNIGDIYRGYVSAREALSKSINIPSVKVLSYVGIDKAKSYAEDMGFVFDEKDDSYSLALGGMTYGVNLLQLASSYSTFANNGKFASAKFVSFITDKNNKLIYINKPQEKQVLREDVSYLITDMLKTCVKSGTAKKLASLDKEIAAKTGTVGKPNSEQNLDAWNVSYTKAQTVCVWLGNLDNTPIPYAGGNQPTEIARNYFSQIEDNSHFTMPSSIVEKEIDATELYENHRIILAGSSTPERYTQKELFSRFNLPTDISNKFTNMEKQSFKGKVIGSNAEIEFDAKNYITYLFKSNGITLKEISGLNSKQKVILPLKSQKQTITIDYYITINPEVNASEEITFVKSKQASQSKDKWFI